MKKGIIIFACFFYQWIALFAQPNVYDLSIDALLQLNDVFTPPQDTLIDIWNELAYKYNGENNYEKARFYAQKANMLAREKKDLYAQSLSFMVQGHVARKTGQFSEARTSYEEAFKIRLAEEKYISAANVLYSLATLCLDDQSHYEEGIVYLKKALALLESSNAPPEDIKETAADFYIGLGDLYCRQGDFDAAIKAFASAEKKCAPYQLFDLYLNSGACFSGTKFLATAHERLESALAIAEQNIDATQMAKAHLNLMVSAFQQDELEVSLQHWAKARQWQSALDTTEKILLLKNRGSIHKSNGEYDAALAIFQEALNALGDSVNPVEALKLHYDMGGIYYDRGQYKKAIEHLSEAKALREKVAMPELEVPTDVFLAAASEKRSLQVSRYLLLGILVLVLIIAIGLIISNYQKRRLAQYKVWQTQQRLDNALNELSVERSFQHLEASEKLLDWVAQELHDRLGNMLSTIKLYFDNLNQEIHIVKAENKEQFAKANALLDDVCEEVRRISRGAKPVNLPDRGLVKEVEHMLELIKDTKQIEVEFIPHGMKQRLDLNTEHKIYRMIGILVNNILMHAQASWFSLQINHFEDHLNIMVEDNGKGFDPEEVMQKGGTGIKHLYSLSAELGGTIQFHKDMKEGSAVSIEIPLQHTLSPFKNSQHD